MILIDLNKLNHAKRPWKVQIKRWKQQKLARDLFVLLAFPAACTGQAAQVFYA